MVLLKQRKISAIGTQKREAILHAAEKEFERRGFGGARMQSIADLAGVPKANVHYYFSGKQGLYNAVLERIIGLWDQTFPPISADDNPKIVLSAFVKKKVEFTRLHPQATRIFTSEILYGGPNLSDYLKNRMTQWTHDRAEVINQWIKSGKIRPVDSFHLIFLIWASTQHYAQSEIQIRSVYQKSQLTREDYRRQAESLTMMVLRICGLDNSESNSGNNVKSTLANNE
ncbi:MAG: TetR family transcriptional regulator [Gammaproteobacteria bacterium]|nr:TetR family transcriptional regulator [Gammaproteobacteria bacterium]